MTKDSILCITYQRHLYHLKTKISIFGVVTRLVTQNVTLNSQTNETLSSRFN